MNTTLLQVVGGNASVVQLTDAEVLAPLVTAATTAATTATARASDAIAARDVTLTAAATYYATQAAGEAATTAGQTFVVAPGDGTATWYRRGSSGSTSIFAPILASAALTRFSAMDRVAAAAPSSIDAAGAVGDGAVNDTAIVTTAVASAAVKLGTSARTYLLSSWATPATAAPVVTGDGATMRGTSTFLKPSQSVNLSKIVFDGWASVVTSPSSGGNLGPSMLAELAVTNATSIPIYYIAPTDQLTVTRSRFDNCAGGYSICIGTNDRAQQDSWSRTRLTYNNFTNLVTSASFSAAMQSYATDSLTLGNFIAHVRSGGSTSEAWGFYHKARYTQIAFNNVRDVDSAGFADVTGMTLKGVPRNYSGASVSPAGYGCLAIGNVTRNIGVNGTRGTGVRAQTSELTIAFNHTEDTGVTGVTIDDATGNDVQSLFNRIAFTNSGTATSGFGNGIAGTAGLTISQGIRTRSIGDTILSAATGYTVNVTGGESMLLADGLVKGASIGVSLTATGTVNGLTMRGLTKQDGGGSLVLINSGADYIKRFRMIDNDHTPDTAPWNGTLPRDCEVRHTFSTTTVGAGPFYPVRFQTTDNWAVAARIRAIGKTGDGAKRCLFAREALLYRNGGALTAQAAAGNAIEVTSDAALSASIFVFGGDTDLYVRLAGGGSDTIHWKITVELLGVD